MSKQRDSAARDTASTGSPATDSASAGSVATDSAARWREILRRQSESGLSVAVFCRRSRLPQSSFYYWRQKLSKASTFAEVRVSPDRVPGASSSRSGSACSSDTDDVSASGRLPDYGAFAACMSGDIRAFEGSVEQDVGTFAACRPRGVGTFASHPSRDAGALELILPDGRRIVVRPGFDRTTLLALVDVLESDIGDRVIPEGGGPTSATDESGVVAGMRRPRADDALNTRRESGV